MSSEIRVVICPQCGAKNRLPLERWGDRAVCGKCRTNLPLIVPFPDRWVEVSDWNFQSEIIDFPGPVLVEFYAPWCGHCQRLAPVMEQLASQYAGRAKVAKLNVDQNPLTASRHAVRSTPALFFFKNGKIRDRVMGALPKEEIERHLRAIF